MGLSKSSTKKSVLGEFFFAEEVPFGMALARIIVPLAVGLPLVYRFLRVRELYTSDGTPTQMFELFGNGPVLPVLPPELAVPLYGILLLCLFTTCIGFRTRLSLCVATPLYMYFNLLDGVGTMTKYSVIGSHLLILLTVSEAGVIWSVDAILRRKGQPDGVWMPPKVPVWPARLMQLLFCFLYFGAAVTKIQTEAFFSGEQMRYWMLSNWNYENPIGEVMAMWAWLLPVSAYFAVVWEILFGFLVFQKRTRLLVIGLGVFFHVMTWLTLGLYIFPTICLSGYLGFVMERDVLYIRRKLRGWRLDSLLRIPVRLFGRSVVATPKLIPAGVTWVCLVAVAAIAATEIDLRTDLYGVNSAEGPLPLEEMDQQVALAMIRDKTPVREKDKFFSFDLGTVVVGNQLANRRTEFTYGETIVAQCNLNPPHEDLWVECVLQDSDNRTIEQFGHPVSRQMLRDNFNYTLGNKLLPGEYSLVLRSNNQEIYRRKFTLVGEPAKVPVAEGVVTN